MNALVLGTGGREHAIAWKLSQSLGVDKVTVHPGNPGIAAQGFPSGPPTLGSPLETAQWARSQHITLAVVGPEALLAEGYADALRMEGIAVVGPNQQAAQLESSKSFAKAFFERAGIPSAGYTVAKTPEEVRAQATSLPRVLKLDGLAAGKGVVVATSQSDVDGFIQRVWKDSEFGSGPHQVVIEEFLPGFEMSYLGFCDGETFVPLATATDYKPVGDGNRGPNTGGMGAISPSPYLDDALRNKIHSRIIDPTLQQMRKEDMDFRGVLFIGLMIRDGQPFVLEFNTRFGDPETQAILLRLESKLETLLEHTANGSLAAVPPPKWSPSTSLYVVAAAEGYPGSPRKGDGIRGLDTLPKDVVPFFSGVGETAGQLVTKGGRVMGVGALGENTEKVRQTVYAAMEKFDWQGRHYRTDIGNTVAMES